jgi:transcription elongation factor Elf1
MWTVRVEPEKTAKDDRMFQCPRCEHSQNVAFTQKQKLVQRR